MVVQPFSNLSNLAAGASLRLRSRSRRATGLLLIGALLSVLPLGGCGKSNASVKGVAPVAVADATVIGLAHAKAGKTVTLRGEMVDKCPVAGCWFHLRDKTGTVKVDTKASGFVVLDVPLHTTMTVTGTVRPGETPIVIAKGLRY